MNHSHDQATPDTFCGLEAVAPLPVGEVPSSKVISRNRFANSDKIEEAQRLKQLLSDKNEALDEMVAALSYAEEHPDDDKAVEEVREAAYVFCLLHQKLFDVTDVMSRNVFYPR